MAGQSTVGVELQFTLDITADPVVYSSWGCIHDITGPEITVASADATCLNAPDGWKEFVFGMKDGGEVTFTLNIQYGDDFNDTLDVLQICMNWRIKIPMNTCAGDPPFTWYILFAAFITKVGNKFEYEGVQMQDYTMKVTGPVTATSPA